jgi:hypothetical protein
VYTQDYVSGLEYRTTGSGGALTLEAIYHDEGRITPNGANYQYEYSIKDHLGNSLLSGTSLQNNHPPNKPPSPCIQQNHRINPHQQTPALQNHRIQPQIPFFRNHLPKHVHQHQTIRLFNLFRINEKLP